MKITYLLLSSLALVMASPVAHLEARQRGKSTYNELKEGECRPVTLVMARGSTETGNFGQIPGPPTCTGLKAKLGEATVACQGIGSDDGYAAALPPNTMPKNTDQQSIDAGISIMNLSAQKCPQSVMVVAGYSQGAALVDNAMQEAPPETRAKVAGVVLFGFTRNQQDNGQIPGYPPAQTKVFCARGDRVCDGTLVITQAHLSYARNADEASSFLASMAQAQGVRAKRDEPQDHAELVAAAYEEAKKASGVAA